MEEFQVAAGVAFGFQETQEAGDALRREVGNLEALDGALAVAGRELQQKEQRVTIAAERVRAHPALRREVVFEEAHELTAEIGGFGRSHDAPPSITCPNERSKRSLACATTAGIQRR